MIGSQLRPLAARALACAVGRRGLGTETVLAAAVAEQQQQPSTSAKTKRSNRMVAAAFEQLKQNNLDEQIAEATGSVEDLLAVAGRPQLQRQHALKIIAALAERAADGPAVVNKFENDPRFKRLCQMLGQKAAEQAAANNDLATVIGVAADDEAARMAHSLKVEQAVKLMSTLALKKRRTVTLLRALAANLTKSKESLSLKQSSDLLYAMATLNFPDETLLDKIQLSLLETLAENKHAAPVCSALTSLGILRYRDSVLFDAMSDWVMANINQVRPQDLVSFLLTLAYTGCEPTNLENLVSAVLARISGPTDAPSPTDWLDCVWALTVLGRLQASQAASVLDPSFANQLQESYHLGPPAKLKLTSIDAAAKLELKDYTGPTLDKDLLFAPTVSKNKDQLVKTVIDALKNLFPNQSYLKTQYDSGMGFLVDAECLVDAKGNPLPLDKPPPAKTKSTRIGLLVWEYGDLCRRVPEPTGPNKLAVRLMQAQGLKLLQVPHHEFSPNEKLVQRVQYLEKKIKSIAKEKKK